MNVTYSKTTVDLTRSHGPEHHTRSCLPVREALARFGALQVWENQQTGRRARVCRVGGQTYGIQILTASNVEITAFVKSKLRRLEQVERYLQNTGYSRME